MLCQATFDSTNQLLTFFIIVLTHFFKRNFILCLEQPGNTSYGVSLLQRKGEMIEIRLD